MKNCKTAPLITVKRRSFCLYKTLDFYLLKEFLIPLTLLILGFIILFFIGDLFDDLGDFLKSKTPSIPMMTRYFLIKIPGHIKFILPLSVLLSCMYTMANMGKSLEITAMRASGIPLSRACFSLYMMAFIVSCISFYLNETVIPWSEREAYILLTSAKRKMTPEKVREYLMKMLTFRSSDGHRNWLFRDFNANGEGKDIILKKLDSFENKKLEWDLKAKRVKFVPKEGWIFSDVTFTPYCKDGFMPEKPQHFKVLKKSVEEIPETPNEIINSAKPPEDLPSYEIIKLLAATKNLSPNLRNMYYTIFFYRISLPWACIIGVLLGIPLAAKNERKGVMTSIISAVIIIVLYQVLSQMFVIFGKLGWLPAIIAGAGPTIGFLIYACVKAFRET